MNTPNANIAEQIAKGIYHIDSVEEFGEVLKDFPKDPALHKAYADLLAKKDSSDLAALSYGRTAALYLKSGQLLPAVVAKLLQWHIKTPLYQDVQFFLAALNDDGIPVTPLKAFFEKLSKPEMIRIIKCMQIVNLAAGQLIYKVGDVQDNLFFIISGRIKEIKYEPVESVKETVFKQSVDYLSADDTFGELYPIDKENVCEAYLETIEPTELVKIPQKGLLSICKKYSNVKSGLKAVSVFRSEFRKANQLKKNRKSQRHKVLRKMSLEIFPHSSANFPIILEAYSRDVSIDGACVVLDASDLGIAKSISSFSKTIKDSMVKISFSCEGMELKVSGKIAWTKEIIFKEEKTIAIGIQFQDLSPKLRGMLFVFADNAEGK